MAPLVDPIQIVRMGGKKFATFVSCLIAAEVAAQKLAGFTCMSGGQEDR